MPLTLEEKKEKVKDNIDPDLLIEVLDVGTEDLVELLEDSINENWDLFEYLEDDNEEEENTEGVEES